MEKNNYELFDEQVDKFLRHQMTAEEKQEFRNLLSTNPELRERARITALMIKGMNVVGKEQDQQIISTIKKMPESKFRKVAGLKPKVKFTHITNRAATKIAAAIEGTRARANTAITISAWPNFAKYAAVACVAFAIAIGGQRYYDFSQTVALGNSQYLAYVQDISDEGYMRGTNDEEVVDQLKHLFANVRDGKDLKQTISELELLYEKSRNEESEYYDFDNDIAWNLAIAYLKDGNKKKPIPILEQLISENKDYLDVSQPAQNLLDQIKKL